MKPPQNLDQLYDILDAHAEYELPKEVYLYGTKKDFLPLNNELVHKMYFNTVNNEPYEIKDFFFGGYSIHFVYLD